jgi:hypothetical protein
MSFTQDELQAFNTILEQRLAAHRRELERAFDSRMDTLKREFEQRLAAVRQDLLRTIPQRVAELQNRNATTDNLTKKLEKQQTSITRAVTQKLDQVQQEHHQQFEEQIENALAAQLLAIEQLMSQHSFSSHAELSIPYPSDTPGEFEVIEVQTEIPWEDLAEVVDKAMDLRITSLNETMQTTLKETEQYLAAQLHTLHEALLHSQTKTVSGNLSSMQDVIHSIEQLERIVESMQVAMNANNTLFSNRLYHHQQLPPERAHPTLRPTPPPAASPYANGITNPFPLLKEQDGEPSHE